MTRNYLEELTRSVDAVIDFMDKNRRDKMVEITKDPERDAHNYDIEMSGHQQQIFEEYERRIEDPAWFRTFLMNIDTDEELWGHIFDQRDGDDESRRYAFDIFIVHFTQYVYAIVEDESNFY